MNTINSNGFKQLTERISHKVFKTNETSDFSVNLKINFYDEDNLTLIGEINFDLYRTKWLKIQGNYDISLIIPDFQEAINEFETKNNIFECEKPVNIYFKNELVKLLPEIKK